MLRGVINQAAAAVGSAVAGYVARASVAVPFIIGLGFAIAALSLLLIEQFGRQNAYLMIAAVFTLIGVVAALIVTAREEEAIDPVSQDSPTVAANEVGTVGAAAMPFAVLGTVLSSLGPAPFLSLLSILGRNLPLVLALGAAGALAWPKFEREATTAAFGTNDASNASFPQSSLRPVETSLRRSMALGTFVIGALLVSAAFMAAFGPSMTAFPKLYVVG